MEPFECTVCKYRTHIRCNIDKHFATGKHKKNILNAPKMPINAPIRAEIAPRNPLACLYCDKVFTHKPSMQRHMNHRCKKNIQLNIIKQQQKTIEIQQQLLSQRPTINTTNNTTNTTNNTVNIQNNITLLAYKDTDTSHLTEKDYMYCTKQPNGVQHLIEKIHFNPMKPENRNISISNLKDKYMMIYNGKQWMMVHKDELDKIYTHKEMLMEEWLEEHPELKESCYQYIQEEERVRDHLTENIKLMMYNKSL
jgi:hypothetical protein